jgi:hypothetical protein
LLLLWLLCRCCRSAEENGALHLWQTTKWLREEEAGTMSAG